MKNFIFIAFIVLLLFSFTGCKESQMCAQEGCEDAVLCKIADHFDITPEDIGKVLKFANATALSLKPEKAIIADAAVRKIINDIDEYTETGGLTYLKLINIVTENIDNLPKEVRAAFSSFIIVSGDDVPVLKLPFTDCDLKAIKKHLNEQLTIIAIYMKG